jgi:hypothetical protein
MPLYMDRHDLPGITAEEVARAHLTDIALDSEQRTTTGREWSRHSDLNRGPAVYETAALPLSYVGAGHRIPEAFRGEQCREWLWSAPTISGGRSR